MVPPRSNRHRLRIWALIAWLPALSIAATPAPSISGPAVAAGGPAGAAGAFNSVAGSLSIPGALAIPDSLSSPFAGFETHFLPNGLKIWLKLLPDDPNVSIAVVTPFGSDNDPPGLEELAHFTEHMLFSDHLGRTEEEIKREVEDLGARRNGVTYSDHTYYYVDIAKEHGLFAVDWLYRIVSPHAMDPAVVERQRQPISVELGARPRDWIDWLRAIYWELPWLELPSFWKREFGLSTRGDRDYYPYRTLQRIGPDDLRWFYDTYYPPGAMTLVIVGDFDRGALWQTLDRTFATLPARPVPEHDRHLRDPRRPSHIYDWEVVATCDLRIGYKFYDPDANTQLMLLFLRDWLTRRLNRRLRYGERKATYSIGVHLIQRGPATYFRIYGEIKPDELAYARSVIEEELALLRGVGLTDEEFDSECQALLRSLKTEYVEPSDFTWAVRRYFFDRQLHRDYPDRSAFYAGLQRDSVAAFCRAHLVPEHEVLRVVAPHPLSQEQLLIAGLFLALGTVWLARRILVRPVEMSRIRYVARFKGPLLYRWLCTALLVLLLAALARLAYFGYLSLWLKVLSAIDSFWIQYALHAVALMIGLLLLFFVLSRIPTKILVFEDQVRIKGLLYGSRSIPWSEISEVSLRRFSEIWLSSRILRCALLALGLFSPGIYLRTRSGAAWFFRVRRTRELYGLLRERWRNATVPRDIATVQLGQAQERTPAGAPDAP